MKIQCPGCGYHMFDVSSPPEHDVKDTPKRSSEYVNIWRDEPSPTDNFDQEVNSYPEKLPGVVKEPRDVLVADRVEIRRLYAQGVALSRIREQLGLQGLSLYTIKTIATAKL